MIERSKDLDLCLFKTDIFWCGILASRLALMESLCGLRLNVVSAKVLRAIPVVSKSSATKVSLQCRDLDAFNLRWFAGSQSELAAIWKLFLENALFCGGNLFTFSGSYIHAQFSQ